MTSITVFFFSLFAFSHLFEISIAESIPDIVPDPSHTTVALGEFTKITFRVTVPLRSSIRLFFNDSEYFNVLKFVDIDQGTKEGTIELEGKKLTSLSYLEVSDCQTIEANSTECSISIKNSFVRITVIKSQIVDYLVIIVGWSYFFAWSISFYPQIFLNIQRKSVIGLNFDFLLLNVIGFTAYTLYNLFLYYNNDVQEEYGEAHPRSPIPVLMNDVVFAVHALFACLVTAAQCFFYEREETQRISRYCAAFAILLVLSGFISGTLATFHVYNILHFVNSLSYIKMAVTLSKYFPQAIYNFCRKSTVGWSIGNVLLDLTGGTLGIIQMILQAENVDDWSAFLGNPVKFGLGLVSIVFDIVFIIQHYILYRDLDDSEYEGVENPEVRPSPSPSIDYGSTSAEAPIIIDETR